MSKGFSSKQIKVLLLCVSVYTVLYFCRLNLSAALDAVATDLDISLATAGLLQTVFAVVYACGQMVNGTIVDHVNNPYRYMLTGLAGSALCNLAMSFAQGLGMMIAIWTANAVFQSMLWTPIVRVVAHEFTGDQERNAANAALAVTLIVGHLFAWAISGFMADRFSWRLSFRAPAIIALTTACIACAVLRREWKEEHWLRRAAATQETKTASASVLASDSFLLVLATCVLYGFVRDGIITWTPTILARMGREQAISPTAFSLILPLINTIGVMIGIIMRGRGANPRRVVSIMLVSALCCCGILLAARGMLATALLLGCVCAAMYGANTMLTGLIPMEYDSIGKSGMTAGMIDAFIYLGSALAGVLAGGIYEAAGMRTLCVIWMAACTAGAVMMTVSGRRKKQK